MELIAIVIIFLLLSVFITTPFIIIAIFREKARKQNLEDRIKIIGKLVKKPQNHNQNHSQNHNYQYQKTHEKKTKLPISRIFIFFLIPIPPIFFLISAPSLSSAIMIVFCYLLLIIVIYFFIKKIKERRYRKSFINQLPNSIDLIIRSLRAGRTIIDSIRTVGEETKGPVADQFINIVDQVELGRDFISVVDDVSKRLNIPEFSFFVIVLSVQQETGGNIIKTLSSLANMLRQRQLMRLKIKTLSAEGVFSAFFMGSLPFLVGGLIMLMRPEYIMTLFYNPTGHKLLVAGFISEVLGCIVIAKMVQIDV